MIDNNVSLQEYTQNYFKTEHYSVKVLKRFLCSALSKYGILCFAANIYPQKYQGSFKRYEITRKNN